MSSKICGAREALSCIKDGDTVAVSGFNLTTAPEYLILELFEMWKETGHPKNLFIISDTLPAVPGRAFDKVFAELYEMPNQDFIRGVLMPFIGWSPALMKMTLENRIEVYSWAIGTCSYWFREAASGRPGIITKVGLGTFLDPRQDGGASNEIAKEKKTCKVSVMEIDGEEWLLYQAPLPDVALIRGTTADTDGYISMEEEGFYGTVLNIAQAAKAQPNPGKVICQVKYVVQKGSIPTRDVIVPRSLVDHVVVTPDEDLHRIAGSYVYDPRLAGHIKAQKTKELEALLPTPDKIRDRIVAGRVLIEVMKLVAKLKKPAFGNLGIGIPVYVSWMAGEFGISDLLTLTVEPGPVGGIALVGQDFGVAISPAAFLHMPDMFTNYEGGIIDFASLGFMQIDPKGNVNPSYSPVRVSGPGGFPVISAGSPRTYFAGGFTAGKGIDIDADGGKLIINSDGNITKFNNDLVKIVFSGPEAVKAGKEIIYVTERAVFGLNENGLILKEVAPGVDVEKDILTKMDFKPQVADKLETMPEVLFYQSMDPLKEYIDNMLKESGML